MSSSIQRREFLSKCQNTAGFYGFPAIDAPVQRGEHEQHNQKRQRQRKAAADVPEGGFNFEVAFGIPWAPEAFISQACKVGHPATRDSGVPWELRSGSCKAHGME